MVLQFRNDVMVARQEVRGKAQEHAHFFDRKFKLIGACSGYSMASRFLPRHLSRHHGYRWIALYASMDPEAKWGQDGRECSVSSA